MRKSASRGISPSVERDLFPASRLDGSIAVGARFRLDQQERPGFVEYVQAWPKEYEAAHGVKLADQLSRDPYLDELADGAAAEVVFESSSRSTLWKDVMVAFVAGLPPQVRDGFVGFYDRVAKRMHPGSA